MRYEMFKDNRKEWRWRFISNRTIAVSSEGYKNKKDCERGIELVKSSKAAKVINLEDAKKKKPKMKIIEAKVAKPKTKAKKKPKKK